MKKAALALLSALSTCAVSTAHANTILNGSFEDSPLSASWLATTGFERLGNNIYGNARDGSLRIVFNSGQATPNGSIAQTVAVSPGSIMELSFWIQMEGTDMGGQLGIAASIIENNEVSHSLACLPKAEGKLFKNWYKYQLSFTPVSATITIRFSDVSTSSDSQDIALDDVVLEPRWTYALNESNQATVRSYNGPGGHVTIPSVIDGYSVKGVVGAYWGSVFGATQAQPNSTITGITIPNGITTIGEYAFADTSLLTSVLIPDSVTSIGGAAFVNCSALTNLTIGSSVTAINAYAFKGCVSLTNVVIPASVTDIAFEAFTDCDSLTSVYFRGNAPAVHPESFSFIASAVTMYHPADATGWDSTFAGWPTQSYTPGVSGDWSYIVNTANEATISGYSGPGGAATIPQSVHGSPVIGIGEWALALQTFTSVSMPEGLRAIGNSAFLGCANLTSVAIPGSVTSVGGGAFYDCRGITNFIVSPDNSFYSAVAGVLFDKSQETLVQFPIGRGGDYTVPDGVVQIGELSFAASMDTGLGSVSIPDTVTHIGGGAFQNNLSLTNIKFGTNVAVLGRFTFVNCGALTNVSLPLSLEFIQEGAFSGCTALANITIPDGVAHIGGEAFSRTAVESIWIPSSVTEIGLGAFQYCTNLTYISVNQDNLAYSDLDGVLFDKSQSNLVQYPCGREGAYAIPEGTASLSVASFKGASKLTSVSIPGSVAAIPDNAFYDCAALADIRIALGVATIGKSSFSGCGALDSIVLPHTLTNIGALVFDRCTSLRSILFLGHAPTIATYSSLPNVNSLGTAPNSVVNFLYGGSGWTSSFGDRPSVMTAVFTQSQHAANRTNGQTDVTTNPSAFSLFTQQQFESNRTAGQSDVISNPMSYGLYTSNSIMDLRMGGLMIQKIGTNAVVSFQPQTTTDLAQPFTNNGTPITNTIPMPGNKGFIRINAKP